MELCERVIGFVWAISQIEARIAAQEYVARRPDTGPLSRWTFKIERLDLDQR